MFATPMPPNYPQGETLPSNFSLPGCLNSTNGGLTLSLSSQQIKDTLGVILPPSNIKGIIDKTAEFVAKNGLEFEQRVLADRSNGSKFAFLVPGNPYRPYYDAKVLEFQTGEIREEVQQQIPQAILEMRRREQEKKLKKEQLLALTSSYTPLTSLGSESTELQIIKDRGSCGLDTPMEPQEDLRPPAPPPEDQYSTPRPALAPIDMDVIKVTAQYVARNGQKFLVALGQRERGNPQFSFLRMNHPLFSYFTALVDAYTRCLVPPKGVIANLKEDIGLASRFSSGQSQICEDQKPIGPIDVLSGFSETIGESQLTSMLNILERVDARHQWECYEEKRNEEEAKREADERQKMHAMDWHEFTVVEVINFTEEDENLLLGAPIDQASLVNPGVVPLSQTVLASYHEDLKKANIQDEPESNTQPPSNTAEKPESFTRPSTDPTSVASLCRPHALVDTSLFPSLVTPPASATQAALVNAHPLNIVTPQGGFSDGPPEPAAPPATPIVVVKDYVRQGKRRPKDSGDMQKCPITGQWIPVDKMSEHLRILLLDPKWKEEKDILLAKAQKESAFTCLSDFEANLANFVVKRPDLFGTIEDECESNYVPPMKRHS